MFARIIADRYARAVLQTCPDLPSIDRAKGELALLARTYRTQHAVREFLLNPKIPPSIKKRILEAALGDRLSETVMRLLILLIERRRQDVLPDIADRYSELCDSVRGVERARVTTAVRIPGETADRLADAIQRFSARQVEVSFEIDPAVMGGVVVRLGDRLIDASLKTRFRDMERAMLAARMPVTSAGAGPTEEMEDAYDGP